MAGWGIFQPAMRSKEIIYLGSEALQKDIEFEAADSYIAFFNAADAALITGESGTLELGGELVLCEIFSLSPSSEFFSELDGVNFVEVDVLHFFGLPQSDKQNSDQ